MMRFSTFLVFLGLFIMFDFFGVVAQSESRTIVSEMKTAIPIDDDKKREPEWTLEKRDESKIPSGSWYLVNIERNGVNVPLGEVKKLKQILYINGGVYLLLREVHLIKLVMLSTRNSIRPAAKRNVLTFGMSITKVEELLSIARFSKWSMASLDQTFARLCSFAGMSLRLMEIALCLSRQKRRAW